MGPCHLRWPERKTQSHLPVQLKQLTCNRQLKHNPNPRRRHPRSPGISHLAREKKSDLSASLILLVLVVRECHGKHLAKAIRMLFLERATELNPSARGPFQFQVTHIGYGEKLGEKECCWGILNEEQRSKLFVSVWQCKSLVCLNNQKIQYLAQCQDIRRMEKYHSNMQIVICKSNGVFVRVSAGSITAESWSSGK